MRKSILIYIIAIIAVFCLCACSTEAAQPVSESPAAVLSEPETQDSAPVSPKNDSPTPSQQDAASDSPGGQAGTDLSKSESPVLSESGSQKADLGAQETNSGAQETNPGSQESPAAESGESEQENQNPTAPDDQTGQEATAQKNSGLPDIIWIGDSLTQGSLGEDNHNENNPQAPWRVLGEISGLKVNGAGFYGYTAHDIFWAYGEYNGIRDPQVTYIYWVGSNDCHETPDNVKYVIEETDRFNANNGITDFLMLGTTKRGDMPPEYADSFNKALSDYYGDKYLDILPYVEYGPDGVHLTEGSYAAVARAVYKKLRK